MTDKVKVDSAFPIDGFSDGMSLRDYFAAAALTGLLTVIDRGDVNMIAEGILGGKAYIGAAYRLADAMLVERGKS